MQNIFPAFSYLALFFLNCPAEEPKITLFHCKAVSQACAHLSVSVFLQGFVLSHAQLGSFSTSTLILQHCLNARSLLENSISLLLKKIKSINLSIYLSIYLSI
jgi:hypothetical protein